MGILTTKRAEVADTAENSIYAGTLTLRDFVSHEHPAARGHDPLLDTILVQCRRRARPATS
jgi:hypothetical protein